MARVLGPVQVAIHNNMRISDIDKFNYWKGCLKGESLSAVSGLTLSSENYEEAVGIVDLLQVSLLRAERGRGGERDLLNLTGFQSYYKFRGKIKRGGVNCS